jgi:hypothetical protein
MAMSNGRGCSSGYTTYSSYVCDRLCFEKNYHYVLLQGVILNLDIVFETLVQLMLIIGDGTSHNRGSG